jgi:hypothetical protein
MSQFYDQNEQYIRDVLTILQHIHTLAYINNSNIDDVAISIPPRRQQMHNNIANTLFHTTDPTIRVSRRNNIYDALFRTAESLDRVAENMDTRVMNSVMAESLTFYKTQEKKNEIELSEPTLRTAKAKHLTETCTICMSQFELGEKLVKTKCKHLFHRDCLAEWVKYKSECPVCRENVKTRRPASLGCSEANT